MRRSERTLDIIKNSPGTLGRPRFRLLVSWLSSDFVSTASFALKNLAVVLYPLSVFLSVSCQRYSHGSTSGAKSQPIFSLRYILPPSSTLSINNPLSSRRGTSSFPIAKQGLLESDTILKLTPFASVDGKRHFPKTKND